MTNEPLTAHIKNIGSSENIEVNDTDIVITTTGGLIRKKDKTKAISIRHIAKVEFKNPGITPGHLKIWYSAGKYAISSYTTMLGAQLEYIPIIKNELSGFPEIYTYLSELIARHPSSGSKYMGGHPSFPETSIDCFIAVQEDGFLVEKVPEYVELFKLPWEKIDSFTTDIKSDWSGINLAAGWLLLGPIGSMLIGKSTKEQLGIVVKGKDGEGNPVKVPIAFDSVKNIAKIKEALDRHMIQAAGITI